MPKRRDLVAMSDEEFWSFAEEQKSIQFASINRDGTPHLVPLWFGIVDGAFVFETFTKSQKIKNLERDPRVTLLLEDGLQYDKLRGAQIRGVAELHADDETVHELSMKVLTRNTPGIPEDALDKVSRAQAAKKTAIVVRPAKIMSWDHTKLGGIY
jgi:PPOX class probable F420-dependent enzyme